MRLLVVKGQRLVQYVVMVVSRFSETGALGSVCGLCQLWFLSFELLTSVECRD